MAIDFLAAVEVEDPSSVVQIFAGSSPINTQPDTLVSGQNLQQYTVVARLTASGKLTQWAPAASDGSEKACGILLNTVDASGGDKACEIYIEGTFNTNALVWPGSISVANKARAFDQSKLAHRPLGWSG